MERETIRSFDGKSISVAVWKKTEKKKGIVQIMHGLSEHIGRYDEFAKFLNKNGFIVIGDDHRGHGQTDPDKLGKVSSDDVFEDTVKDELYITETFGKRFGLPVVILGHSYGSFLAQRYMSMQSAGAVSGYILSGAARIAGAQLGFGRLVAKRKWKKKKDADANIIINQTFKRYDRKFKEGKNDWLSGEPKEVGKYNLDPLCGFPVSYGFYRLFFDGIKTLNRSVSADKKTPVLIASGAADAFGGFGRSSKKLYKRYRRNGFNAQLKLYAGARHEILNETNKKEVYSDFLGFMTDCIPQE